MKNQPWIGKPITDLLFIISPPFLSLLFIVLFPSLFQNNSNMPEAWWVVLVLLVDVAHVYSTVFRTYFDPSSLHERKRLLWSVPFIGFVAGVLVYSFSSVLFWRILAYVAVFHFIRQQYGFMRLYSRKEQKGKWTSVIDTITIYAATLYPIMHWHLSGQKNFNWFVEGDFIYMKSEVLVSVLAIIYTLVLLIYVIKELYSVFAKRYLNVPKIAVITGTALSWYFGIVYLNGDMAFTLLNVVSHGIPYMALVWLFGKKKTIKKQWNSHMNTRFYGAFGVVLFIGVLFLFAFIEEFLWNITVWHEQKAVFAWLGSIQFTLDEKVLCFIVPLLSLPQVTHYILDGFIWKIRKEEVR